MQLNDGHTMPQLGLGLMRWGSESETASVIARAANAGYRLFDTASVYGTELHTGAGLHAIDVPREELFITTKLWNDSHGSDAPRIALVESLRMLGLEYLDLYLIHWPLPMFDTYSATWQALVDLQREGAIRSIGVSNFNVDHLERIIDETGVVPAVNQVEMHPYFQQRRLREFHDSHGIVTQAWSPFGGGGSGAADILDDPVVCGIAAKHSCAPSQVILQWHMSCGASVIPKSTSLAHLEENMAAINVALDDDDMAAFADLDRRDGRCGPDPLKMDMIKL
ncbi:MAG: aldo/keto reductase [Caenibius sp.]